MVIRRTTYPQVEPRADGLMTRAVAVVPSTLSVEEAGRVARRRDAAVVLARRGLRWEAASADLLERALALGLHRAPLEAVLWPAPPVSRRLPEVAVRRRLSPATPLLVVLEGGRPVGVVAREPGPGRVLPRSAAPELARLDALTARLLRAAGKTAAELGWPVAVVGGFPRDLLGGRLPETRRDVDLTVEGHGRTLARRLAATLGGDVREHEAFDTATVTLTGARGPRSVDVATARRERYRAPGALPTVEAASLATDLGRRDFSVNALAIRLDGPAWGDVLDPTGGLADLEGKRLRILHPLSFVEDPTRIFRLGRFAARLGFHVEPATRRLLAAAARLDAYGALSGDRLLAELDAILGEAEPATILTWLGRAGAFRLLAPGYLFTARTAMRVARVAAVSAALELGPVTRRALYLAALGEGADDPAAWLTRWSTPAPLRSAAEQATGEAPGVLARLEGARGVEEAYAVLRGTPENVAAWAHVLAGDGGAGRHLAAYLGRWRRVRPLLTGDDLAAMGIAPGPKLGRLLQELRAAQVAGRLRSRRAATAWVRRAAAIPSRADPTKGGQ